MAAWKCPRCKLTNPPGATNCDCGFSTLTQQTSTDAAQPDAPSPRLRTAAMVCYALLFVCWMTAPGKWEQLGSLDLPELIGQLLGMAIALTLFILLVIGIASLWRRNRSARRRTLVAMITSLVMSLMMVTFTVRLAARRFTESPWDYRVDEHGILLTLPSSRWKRAERQLHLADFVMPDLAPILAGILSVESAGQDRFDAQSTEIRSYLRRNSDVDQKPRFQTGETSAGSHYTIAFWTESAEALKGKLWVARCASWLADKEVLVRLFFERQGSFIGRTGQAVERSEFEENAVAICKSVR